MRRASPYVVWRPQESVWSDVERWRIPAALLTCVPFHGPISSSLPSLSFVLPWTDYLTTAPDAVAEFSAPISKHMNDDHSDTTRAMIAHFITGGVEVTRRRCKCYCSVVDTDGDADVVLRELLFDPVRAVLFQSAWR